jgi:hypothetical protein
VTETVVYVLRRDKTGPERVEKRAIRTGADDGSQIQILGGLRDGEEVVLAGLQRLGVTAIDAQQGRPQASVSAR